MIIPDGERHKIITGDSAKVLAAMPAGIIDAVITSPPYGDLRDYHGYSFDFAAIAKGLARVIKDGGVIMWNVGDVVIGGSETLQSFRQAIYFVDECGLRMHDTMIYEKTHCPFPANPANVRYNQMFEYVFILSKGAPKTTNLIADKINRQPGLRRTTQTRGRDGIIKKKRKDIIIGKYGVRGNVWRLNAGYKQGQTNPDAYHHPATMPLALAADHIKTWSAEGDVILDPFSGSGTSGVAALQLDRRYIGIDISAGYNALAERRIKKEVGTLLRSADANRR